MGIAEYGQLLGVKNDQQDGRFLIYARGLLNKTIIYNDTKTFAELNSIVGASSWCNQLQKL